MSRNDAQIRADALERTVTVLKRKVYELYNGGSQSSLHKQLEKARRREEENRRKRELVEMRANELKRYSETLEAEVQRRTEAIKTIVDNVTFGFLVVNRELVVMPECTKSCSRLFGVDKVEGSNLCDLLCLSGRERLGFLLGADQVFENILPVEVSLAQMQHKFSMKSETILNVEASVVRDKKTDDIIALLLTVSDITALESATRESNNNRTLVSILRQKESFRQFMLETKGQIDMARRALSEANQSLARHAIHTIKGNSASYGLEDIVAVIHHVEESLELRIEQVKDIEDAFRSFLEMNEGVLEIDYDEVGDEGFEVSREQMSNLKQLISTVSGREASDLKKWTARVLRRPAWQLLGPVEDFAERLATRLGKKLTFKLEGADTTVDVEVMRPVFAVVSHLVRNAVDHGVEAPRERGKKPLEGELLFEIRERDDSYVLRCRDDGRGIDTEELGRRAVQIGHVDVERLKKMSDAEKKNLIFVDGLSSARVTTSISGRGVGMSAVKAAVAKVSGTVSVESEPNRGTTIVISVPKPDEITRLDETRKVP